MKLINRGFISIRPKQAFWDWANEFESDLIFSVDDGMDPTIYLITEDFFDAEPIIEQHFKKIFASELSMITESEEDWPPVRTADVFLEWFNVEVGTTVFDLEKADLKSEKI
jgi:hypothetical protein